MRRTEISLEVRQETLLLYLSHFSPLLQFVCCVEDEKTHSTDENRQNCVEDIFRFAESLYLGMVPRSETSHCIALKGKDKAHQEEP